MFIGSSDSPASVLSKISQHQQFVEAEGRYRKCCPRCNQTSSFGRHDVRSGGLRVLVECATAAAGQAVRVVRIVLARWRCNHCRRVFTDYPDFRTPL